MAEENGEVGDIVTCPTCQKIWPRSTKFCTQCGTWIESGQVLDESSKPTPPTGPRPGSPGIGSAPPGITPIRPSGVPAQPAASQTGGHMPPVVPPALPQEGAPPKKKYSFKVEPRREEHLPQGPAFIPVREEKKKARSKPGQVLLIIVCILAIGFAVLNLAFKPLKGYLFGMVLEQIGKTEAAIKQYQTVTFRHGGTWADKSRTAMTRIGRDLFTKHIELQHYENWTADSEISISQINQRGRAGGRVTLKSTIACRDDGFVVEDITLQNGQLYGKRLRTSSVFGQRLDGAWFGLKADQMNALVGFGPDALFEHSGKQKLIDMLFDDLGMRLQRIDQHDEDETLYEFLLRFDDDQEKLKKFKMLTGPFVSWSDAPKLTQTKEVGYSIRAKDGFLTEIQYRDTNGATIVVQTFSNFTPGADIPDSRFEITR